MHELGDAGAPAIVFAHGFGCSQDMWRLVAPAFAHDHRVVLFDHVGSGDADAGSYDQTRHATLDGYAEDVVELLESLDLGHTTFVGHSVSAMIGVLVARNAPHLLDGLVLVCPSPRYLDAEGYRGGFAPTDMEELLTLIDRNYLAWADAMAPTIMGNPQQPELAGELQASFCRTDPAIAQRFARATFLADNRHDLAAVAVRSLVIQSADDVIAPMEVGQYVAEHLQDASLVVLDVSGHCPNLSAPEPTAAAIRQFVSARSAQRARAGSASTIRLS